MLRAIRSPHVRPRLIGYSVTTAASAVNTPNVGIHEATFTNADNDNELDAALVHPFSRVPVHVASPGVGIGDGGTAYITADPTISALSATSISGAGAADVGQIMNLILGHDSADTNRTGANVRENLHPVYGSFRRGRIITGQVSGTGAVSIGGSSFTATKNGTGDYTINFDVPFARTPVAVVTVKGTSEGASARVESISAGSMNILAFDAANSASSEVVNFIVLGADSADEYAMQRGGVIRTRGLDPRLLSFHVSALATTPVLDVGDGDASITDNGVGDITLTYTNAFAREPIVIATSGGATDAWASVSSSSSTAARIELTDATASGLGDPSDLHVLVLGFDNADEF